MSIAKTNAESNSPLPITMRWRETVSDGKRHWYLAGLKNDASFWGYVHIRTDSLSENRSFDGRIEQSMYTHIRSLVDGIVDADPESPGDCDGFLGLGTRSTSNVLVSYKSDSPESPNAKVFLTIVELLQPILIDAAKR